MLDIAQLCTVLAAAIDAAAAGGRKVRIVIGDGALPQSEIKSRGAFVHSQAPVSAGWTLTEEDAAYWDVLEGVRVRNSWGPAGETYYLLGVLIRLGLVDCVITTNYDMVLDHYSENHLDGVLALNPVPGENPRLWNGFICDDVRLGEVAYFKTHGSLGFVRFDRCEHTFKAPEFRVHRVDPHEYAQDRLFHCSLKRCGVRHGIPDMRDEERARRPTGGAHHLTDMNFSRTTVFGQIIDAANERLTGPGLGAILAVGFRGAADEDGSFWEELVNPIVECARTGAPVVALLAQQDTAFPGYPGQVPSVLADRLDELGLSATGSGAGVVEDLLYEALGMAAAVPRTADELRRDYEEYLQTFA